jgi:hypothetical protein
MKKILTYSVIIAFLLLVLPILPYKIATEKCLNLPREVLTPVVCDRSYIPFEQGVPFKFYETLDEGFYFYNGPGIIMGDNMVWPTNLTEENAYVSVPWFVPFILDLIALSSLVFVILYLFKVLRKSR